MNTIIGKCEVHHDKSGQPYLAVDINELYYSQYANFMLSNNFYEDVDRKLKRDKGCYHVTLFSAAHWGSLTKRELANEILEQLSGKEVSFLSHGIGKAEKDEHYAHFVILENQEINNLRAKYNLPPNDFHMTLAFNEKDVHGVPKNKETCVYKLEEIMKLSSLLKIQEFNHVEENHSLKMKP